MTFRRASAGFTMVELLVVVAVIVILLGAIIGIGGKVISGAKVSDTETLFRTLGLAIEQFNEDAPLAKVRGYTERYGNYPPDELEAFSAADGIPPSPPVTTLLSSTARLEDEDDTGLDASLDKVEHRDVKAMLLAIKVFSAESAAILDQVDERFKQIGKTAARLTEYYDPKDNSANAFRQPLVYLVDSWGTPIEYYATVVPGGPPPSATFDVTHDKAPDHPSAGTRRIASTALITANNGQPVFVSYGPDGEEQFAKDVLTTVGQTQVVWDFNDDFADAAPAPGSVDRTINHTLNHDNIYSSPALADRLAAGLPD